MVFDPGPPPFPKSRPLGSRLLRYIKSLLSLSGDIGQKAIPVSFMDRFRSGGATMI